eukprot:gene22280-51372_t
MAAAAYDYDYRPANPAPGGGYGTAAGYVGSRTTPPADFSEDTTPPDASGGGGAEGGPLWRAEARAAARAAGRERGDGGASPTSVAARGA